MNFELYARTAFDNFIIANGGFKGMEDKLKEYVEEGIQEGDDFSWIAESFCCDLDVFENYLTEAVHDLLNVAKINVSIEFE